MRPTLAKRWLHPQTVPRGFLRIYILTQISQHPQTGYSMIQRIEEKTDGAWRPGPGTMYPLLKSLVSQSLVRVGTSEASGGKVYAITPRGRKELEEIRKTMLGAGRKEPVMARLFSDLLPGEAFVQMVLKRYREGSETLRQKIREIPEPQRRAILKELRVLAEGQLEWVDAELKDTAKGTKA